MNTDALNVAVAMSDLSHAAVATRQWSPCGALAVAGTSLSVTSEAGVFAVHPPIGRPSHGRLSLWITHYPVLTRESEFDQLGLRYPGDAAGRASVESALRRLASPTLILSGHLHARAAVADGTLLEISVSPSIEPPFELTMVDVAHDTGTYEVRIARLPLAEWGAERLPILTAASQRWTYDSAWRLMGAGPFPH